MATFDPTTSGYEYPRVFQPQGKLQWRKSTQKALANSKKPVIKGSKGSNKPIVKKKSPSKNKAGR